MLITPPANFGATSRRDNRVYLRRRVITFMEQFLRTFGGGGGGGFNAKSVGFWGSLQRDPLAGREGCPPPAPSPGRLRLQLPATPSPVPPPPPPPPPPPRSQFLDPPLSLGPYCSAIKFVTQSFCELATEACT